MNELTTVCIRPFPWLSVAALVAMGYAIKQGSRGAAVFFAGVAFLVYPKPVCTQTDSRLIVPENPEEWIPEITGL